MTDIPAGRPATGPGVPVRHPAGPSGADPVLDVPTARGTARLEVEYPDGSWYGLLVLGHGAGGDVTSPDLLAVRAAALRAGMVVARVTQPYRVAGRRAPAPAGHLDQAWLQVIARIRRMPGLDALPLVVGGRSSGARVACRTARAAGAAGVLALAFPLHPPGRPERSRAAELATGLPTLVVNGDRDPFGVPEPSGPVQVHLCPGQHHDLAADPERVAAAAVGWLAQYGWASGMRR